MRFPSIAGCLATVTLLPLFGGCSVQRLSEPSVCPAVAQLEPELAVRMRGRRNEYFGTTTIGPGDVNGDGFDDILIAGFGEPGVGQGGRVVVAPGSADLFDADIRRLFTVEGGPDHDLVGVGLAAAGDVNHDGSDDLLIAARERLLTGEQVGRVYLLESPFEETVSLFDATTILVGRGDHGDVTRVSAMTDFDGDGTMDLLAGSNWPVPGQPGRAYLFLDVQPGETLLEDADAIIEGFLDDLLGRVVVAGDIDGDGLPEALVGAENSVRHGQRLGVGSGVVHVLHDPASLQSTGERDLQDYLYGTEGSLAGHSLAAAGDVNGDGRDDFLVGAPYDTVNGEQRGRAYLVTEEVIGPTSITTAIAFDGEAHEDRVGNNVAGVGDVNGDGYADVMIGAKFHDAGGTDAGAAYLVLGPITDDVDLGRDAALKIIGEDREDNLAIVAGVGDLTGDGFDNMVVGARQWGDDDATGATYVIRCRP